MEWENVKVFQLIDLYRDRPVLWDCRLKEYKDKNKKLDALMEIAASFGVEKELVERKIKNLVSHFLRELKKERESSKSGAGSEEVYKSKWFCYNNMLFLKDRNQPKGMTDTTKQDLNTTVNEDNIEDETQNVDQDQVATKDASGSWENRNKRFPKSLPDRPGSQKKQKTSATEEALSIMREIQGRNVTVTDQYKSFGDQVGLRIRDLPSSNAQTIVKHLISNILFEAEMGKYDNGNPLSTSQPFYPIPNYIQQQFSVPMAPVYPNTNHHFELPSYSGRMQATSPQSHIQQQFSVPMAPVCPNSNHNFERPSQVTSPQSVVSPTPSAYSLTDSDSVDNLLMEL